MAITFLQPSDLNEDHFEIKQGKVCAKRKSSKFTLNWAISKDIVANHHPRDYDNPSRRYLQVVDGIGKFHLDFMPKKDISGITNIFALPAGCPRPNDLVEVQTHDGGSVFMTAGATVIQGLNLKANTRYIVDLLAFFPDY